MVVSSRDETAMYALCRTVSLSDDTVPHLSRRYALCDPVTLTFDLFIGGWSIVTDYPCAKFGDFGLSRFGFIVRTDRQTESQMRMITILTRLSPASVNSLCENYVKFEAASVCILVMSSYVRKCLYALLLTMSMSMSMSVSIMNLYSAESWSISTALSALCVYSMVTPK